MKDSLSLHSDCWIEKDMMRAGLPIGLQMMGRPWCEDELVSACSVIEAAARERVPLPKIYYNVLHGDPNMSRCTKDVRDGEARVSLLEESLLKKDF